jgi:hypothetical protein
VQARVNIVHNVHVRYISKVTLGAWVNRPICLPALTGTCNPCTLDCRRTS